MAIKSFYSDPENLKISLGHYLGIFSEGHDPIVPVIRHDDGTIDIDRTFQLFAYRDFPYSEKVRWLYAKSQFINVSTSSKV